VGPGEEPLADRAEEQSDEAASAAVADDDQLGGLGLLDEGRDRMAPHELLEHVDLRVGGADAGDERADVARLRLLDRVVVVLPVGPGEVAAGLLPPPRVDRDKAEFCYQLCRASNARRIVEIGTSYGVSTLYLAAAVRDNARASGGDGIVIGTEYEPGKAKAAREHFAEAGLASYIDLREGDLRQTLKRIDGPVDFMLVDIWISMSRPALELVAPHLRPGAMVVTDNTAMHRSDYADYFAFINDPAKGFRTMTLPFDGGLELSVRCQGA